MASTSSSSSSASSSSSGEIQSKFALLEDIEGAILAVASGAQEYTIGDRRVKRAELSQLMAARKILLAQINRESGRRPLVAEADFTGNFSE